MGERIETYFYALIVSVYENDCAGCGVSHQPRSYYHWYHIQTKHPRKKKKNQTRIQNTHTHEYGSIAKNQQMRNTIEQSLHTHEIPILTGNITYFLNKIKLKITVCMKIVRHTFQSPFNALRSTVPAGSASSTLLVSCWWRIRGAAVWYKAAWIVAWEYKINQ